MGRKKVDEITVKNNISEKYTTTITMPFSLYERTNNYIMDLEAENQSLIQDIEILKSRVDEKSEEIKELKLHSGTIGIKNL